MRLWPAKLCLILLGSSLAFAQESTDKTLPKFENGQAQPVREFADPADWIRHDLWVETEFDSDGNGRNDRMYVAVTRQKQTDTENLKVPVVYESSPYYSRAGELNGPFFWDPKHELGATPPQHEHLNTTLAEIKRPILSQSYEQTWVPRGFAMVHSCSPGTGLSEGCPTVGGDNESLAPKAVIDWLCGRAKGFTTLDGDEEVKCTWCTGKVGMMGTSYNGTIPLAAATTGVEGLEAIIPVAPNTSYYHYYRSNGLVRHPFGYMGEDIDVLYDFIHSGNPEYREHCDCTVRDDEMAKNQDRITGDYNSFWAGRDYLNDMGPMRAALLMAHGWNDWNVVPEHSVRIYLAAKAKGLPVQLYCHQFGHGGDPPLEMMNRWFTRFLYGVENGVENEPRSRIVREDDDPSSPTSYPDYPHPEAMAVTFRPGPGGQQQGTLSLVDASASRGPAHGDSAATILEKLVDDAQYRGPVLAQAEQSQHRLLYVTPELKAPIHLSGFAKIKLRLASSKPAANLTVWLINLPWSTDPARKSTDNLITRAWADPQNHQSLTKSEPLVPGQFYDLEFDLQPDDQIIPAGKRIGLMIFSSDPDFTLQPQAGTELTIDLNQTSLQLPIVGGQESWNKAQ